MPDSQEQTPKDFLDRIKQKAEETLVAWGPPGLGLGLTAHFAKNGQWWEAAITLILTGLVTVLIKYFNKLDSRLDKLAEWLASNTENFVLQLWWKLTSQFQGRYYTSLIYIYRDFRTQGLKTKGPFALDLEKVFVPLRVAPESVDRISAAMIQSRDAANSLDIWSVLAAIPQQPACQRIVIIGPPGSGKSTLLEHLALTYAKQRQRQHHRQAPRLIPVLLYLRDVRQLITGEQAPDLATLLEQQELQKLKPHPQWFENQLKQGRCLVMLDGLDEVADEEQRQAVSRWVDRQMRTYPKTPFILTSRPFGYRSAELTEVGTLLEVQPFNLKQMQQFVESWYLQNELMRRLGKDDPGVRSAAKRQADDLIDRIKHSPSLAAMALNPLLLTMIATVHCFRGALPGRRVELYAEICDVLLGRRQDAKGMVDRLTAPQKKLILQGLALKLMHKQTREFRTITGFFIINERLTNVAGTEADPVQFLKQIETVSGLLVERQSGVYEFAHKSFQEYLAAVHIKELKKENLLVRAIDDPWWDETIRLYAAQSDATNLIWAALDKPSVVSLTLAHDCLEEGLSVQPDVRQQLEDTLEAGLESTDPEIFKLAAEVKLSRRLTKLLRIDEKTEIDATYITCAEYQLFIDEKRQSGENRQPDHWTSYRFASGDAAKPIAGVRASDAEEFCGWLTQRQSPLGDTFLEGNSPVFVGDAKFRLPTLNEIQDHPAAEKQLGSWCKDEDKRIIGGIQSTQWKVWQDALVDRLALAHKLDLTSAFDLARDIDIDLDRVRDIDLARARARDIDIDLARDIDLALARARVRDLDLARVRDLDHDYNANSIIVRSYLLLLLKLWAEMSDAYQSAARNPKLLRSKKLTRKECENLSVQYLKYRDETLDLYAFFVLLDERRKEQMPAWESIRIVREKIKK